MNDLHFNELEVCGDVYVDHNPAWIGHGINKPEYYAGLQALLDFYVFENPNDTLTSRSRSVSSYGWKDPWRKPTYLNHKLKDASNNKFLYYSADKLENMENALRKAGLLDSEVALEIEAACFFDCRDNQTMSCLYHMRNSICHGRFAFFEDGDGSPWIALEDVSSPKKGHKSKRLSARMLFRFETLEKWKALITNGPESLD